MINSKGCKFASLKLAWCVRCSLKKSPALFENTEFGESMRMFSSPFKTKMKNNRNFKYRLMYLHYLIHILQLNTIIGIMLRCLYFEKRYFLLWNPHNLYWLKLRVAFLNSMKWELSLSIELISEILECLKLFRGSITALNWKAIVSWLWNSDSSHWAFNYMAHITLSNSIAWNWNRTWINCSPGQILLQTRKRFFWFIVDTQY